MYYKKYGRAIFGPPIFLLYNREIPFVNSFLALQKIFSPFHKKSLSDFRKMPIEIGLFGVLYLNQGKGGTLQWKSKSNFQNEGN